MKQIPVSDAKDLSKLIRQAEHETIVFTRRGKPAGVLVGFTFDDDWFGYKLEHDERFLKRIEQSRKCLRRGKGVKLEDAFELKGRSSK